MKKAIMSIFSTFLSILLLCPTAAYAITPDYAEEQVIAAAPANGKTSAGEYTVSPGDTVQYSASLELPGTAALINIQPHSSMRFVSGGTLYVMNGAEEVIYTQGLGYTSTDGYFYDLSDLPAGGGMGYFTYVVAIDEVPSTGLTGMSCTVIVSDANGHALATSESPAVYSLAATIQTVDTHLPEEKTATKEQGIVTYNGQHVEGASFSLYRDKELTESMSFMEGFRSYTVCPDGREDATQLMTADISGTLNIKGLQAGTYYLVEEQAPVDYYNVTAAPVVISLDLEKDSSGKLKLVMNETELENKGGAEKSAPKAQVIQLSNKGMGASVVLDYKYENQKPRTSRVIAVCCGVFAVGCGCFVIGASCARSKKGKDSTAE